MILCDMWSVVVGRVILARDFKRVYFGSKRIRRVFTFQMFQILPNEINLWRYEDSKRVETFLTSCTWEETKISIKSHKLILWLVLLRKRENKTIYSHWRNIEKQNLTGGNWQKWKRVFLTCPCHEIYRDEAVGLKNCKNTWKNTIFVKMWNLGQYRENLIFCQ